MLTASLIIFARIAIGLVFAIAVAGKLRAPRDFEQALRDFGFPGRHVSAAARAVVAAEAALVVALAVPVAVVCGAALVAAALLLAAYTALIARAVARRARFGCNCLGAGGTRFISGYDVARNGVLLAAATAGAIAAVIGAGARVPADGVVLLACAAAGLVVLAVELTTLVTVLTQPLQPDRG